MGAQGNIFGFGYFGNLIRRWLKDNPPFYPLYANFFLNRKLPILVDTNNLMLVYLQAPILRAIIDAKAGMLKNMVVEAYTVDSKGVETPVLDHPVLQLLNYPNPLQSFEDFLAQYSIYRSVYSNAFIYKLKGFSGAFPTALWLLPPGEMKIIPTGKLFNQTKVENIIDHYEMYNSGQGAPYEYKPQEIIHYCDGTSDKYFFGESKILTNKLTISNIQGALKTRNIIINDKGAIGILSNDADDKSGGIPLGKTEKENIEKEYRNKYGLSDDQMRILMTTSKVKWQPMSYPTKDLMLFEEIEDGVNTLCAEYGLWRDVLPSTKGATFENMKEALRMTYQNTIQQEGNTFLAGIERDPDMGLKDKGIKLRASFAHVPAMKENEKEKSEADMAEAKAFLTNIQAIAVLNQSVQSYAMTRQSAIEACMTIMGYDKERATAMINEPMANPNGQAAQGPKLPSPAATENA